MQIFGNEIDGVRYRITIFLIAAIVFIAAIVLALTAFGKTPPEYIGAAVLGVLGNQLGSAVTGLFKSRDDIQTAKTEVAKIEAAKT
jgi:hypothetical protein